MKKTKCPVCENFFSAQEALCEDWKDPKKSFGCPHCSTFFERKTNPTSKERLTSGIMAGGIGVPSLMMVGHYFRSGDLMFVFYGVTIFLSFIAINCINMKEYSNFKGELKKVDS